MALTRKPEGEKTAAFYTCNECGGDTWKLTNPLAINVVSLLFFGFMLFMSTYALISGFLDEDPEGWIILLATPVVGYLLYKNCRKNSSPLEKIQDLGKEEAAPLKQRPLLLWVVACRFCPPGLIFLGLLIQKAFPGYRFPARHRGKSLFEP